jgi:hypothetical protein
VKRKRKPDPFRDGLYPIQEHVVHVGTLGSLLFGRCGHYNTNFDAVDKRRKRERWKAPPRPGYEWFDAKGRLHWAKTRGEASKHRQRTERRHIQQYDCNDCKINTVRCGEFYMLKQDLWEKKLKLGLNDNLCVGCLEARLGRRLTIGDMQFLPTYRWQYPQSDRLIDRIGPWLCRS